MARQAYAIHLGSEPQYKPHFQIDIDSSIIRDPALIKAAQKLAHGDRPDFEDGLAMMTTGDILGLGSLAHQARLAHNGKSAFYVVNRHINYSNICVNHCAFCAFWRDSGQDGAYAMTTDQAAELAAQSPELDIRELHIVGSCHPDLDLSYYLELLDKVREKRPQAVIKAFTAVEIDHIAKVSGLGVRQVLQEMKQHGLAGHPGGGAEIFSPRTRSKICPRKISAERWLEVCAQAHSLGLFTNATMLYGHLESPAERVEHLLSLRNQQDVSGGFNAFIPLAFHPQNTELSNIHPSTGLDDLRVIAASRLLLDNFPHIKAYWVMLGEKLAQVALHFGADDLDGTIVEERITHSAGATSAKGLTEAELRHAITAAGFEPVRRDGFYNSLEQA